MAISLTKIQDAVAAKARENSTVERLYANAKYTGFIAKVLYYSLHKLGDDKQNSVALHVEKWAEKQPQHPAILFEERRYTYAQFNAFSNRVASTLRRLGAQTDESVALLMDNRPEYLFTIVGANKLGMVTGLINTNLTGDQLVHAFKITEADWIVVGAEFADRVEEIADKIDVPRERIIVWSEPGRCEAEIEDAQEMDQLLKTAQAANLGLEVHDPKRRFLYICTSGTTGLPKAVKIPNQRFLRAIYYFGQAGLNTTPDDVMYTSGMPLYHNAGISQGWGVVLTGGGTVVLRRKFSVSEFWDDVHRYGVTLFSYIGEVCRYLLNGEPHPKERDHNIRAIIGAGLRPEIWEEFTERFNIPQVIEYYGATEGNVGLINLINKPGVVGRMMPGNVLAKVDPDTEEFIRDSEGNLVKCEVGESGIMLGEIRGTSTFEGYVDKSKNESKVLENPFGEGKKYFDSGDLLNLHENNFVSFADRLGDTFRWKGENVATNDVQAVLDDCPGVVEACVYGVKISGQGGRAGAAALRVDESFDWDTLAEFVKEHLPSYSWPYFVRLEDELPMTGSFKLVKTGLKKDGLDPAEIDSELRFLHPKEGGYVKVTKKLHDAIHSGDLQF
jgi:acyl-CoA synthetase (AMP-forming)/AMP-acid ligase II